MLVSSWNSGGVCICRHPIAHVSSEQRMRVNVEINCTFGDRLKSPYIVRRCRSRCEWHTCAWQLQILRDRGRQVRLFRACGWHANSVLNWSLVLLRAHPSQGGGVRSRWPNFVLGLYWKWAQPFARSRTIKVMYFKVRDWISA